MVVEEVGGMGSLSCYYEEGLLDVDMDMDMDMVVEHMDHEEGMNKGWDTHMDVVKNHNCPLIKATTTTQN